MLNETLYKDEGKRPWVTTLCGCYQYRNPEGQQRWCPTFCLTGLLCTNALAGQVCSRAYKEKPFCFNLGWRGCCVCLSTIPVSAYHPLAAMAVFCLLTHRLRVKIIQDYNVEEEKMLVSLEEWQAAEATTPKAVAIVPDKVGKQATGTAVIVSTTSPMAGGGGKVRAVTTTTTTTSFSSRGMPVATAAPIAVQPK
eukprot:scaffold976_cov214-Ochromonas_danica.AAC.8